MKNTIEKSEQGRGKGFQTIDSEKTVGYVDFSCGNGNQALCRKLKSYAYIKEVSLRRMHVLSELFI